MSTIILFASCQPLGRRKLALHASQFVSDTKVGFIYGLF